MGDIIYLTLRGAQQGTISAGCGSAESVGNRYQQSHPDEIFVFSLQQEQRHGAQGMLTFCKTLDKSSPLLAQAINNNESLSLNFDCYRINRSGRWEKYYRIELSDASIQHIGSYIRENNIEYEYITVVYKYYRCQHLTGGTEHSTLVTPVNYKPPAPVQKALSEKRKITLTLGFFFDGTGNNAVNTRNMLAAATASHFAIDDPDAISILERNAKLRFGLTGSDATSYKGYYTNIHWLHELYLQRFSRDSAVRQAGIYIEGIGTRAGEADSQIGMGLGISDTGVIAKTDDAVKEIVSALQKVRNTLDGQYEIATLQFDIFGFSRGAAAARHFANRVQGEDGAIIAAIRQGMGQTLYHGAPAGKTRFIGLFDTVAAIGTPTNGLNPHSADTGEVNIRLRPGVAEAVFHITAGHECRFNFASNSVRPAWPELVLPGAHSDIGGGYLPQERENLFLTRPEVETVPLGEPGEQTRAYRRAMAQLRTLEASPVIAAIMRNNEITPEVWVDAHGAPDSHGQRQQRSYAALTLRQRVVRNDWAKVTLRVMLEAAKASGVAFNDISSSNLGLDLPAELRPLVDKVLAEGRAVRCGRRELNITPEALDMLAARYIHCSANWNAVQLNPAGEISGGAAVSETIGFVNRPDEHWRRTVYNMEGKRNEK